MTEGAMHDSVWIGWNTDTADDIYFEDGSYVQVDYDCLNEIKNAKYSYYGGGHSAVSMDLHPDTLISKWNDGPVMKHSYWDGEDACPYTYTEMHKYIRAAKIVSPKDSSVVYLKDDIVYVKFENITPNIDNYIKKVEYYVDGTFLGVRTAPPFKFEISLTKPTLGRHGIKTVISYRDSQTITTDSITVFNYPIEIQSPTNDVEIFVDPDAMESPKDDFEVVSEYPIDVKVCYMKEGNYPEIEFFNGLDSTVYKTLADYEIIEENPDEEFAILRYIWQFDNVRRVIRSCGRCIKSCLVVKLRMPL